MDNTSISKVLQNVFGPNFFCHIAPANGGGGGGRVWEKYGVHLKMEAKHLLHTVILSILNTEFPLTGCRSFSSSPSGLFKNLSTTSQTCNRGHKTNELEITKSCQPLPSSHV